MRFIKTKSLIVAIAVFVLLIFLHSLDLLNPVERSFTYILAPIQKYFYNSGLKARSTIDNITTKQNATQTELLKAQIRSLLVQNARYKILAEENFIRGYKQAFADLESGKDVNNEN